MEATAIKFGWIVTLILLADGKPVKVDGHTVRIAPPPAVVHRSKTDCMTVMERDADALRTALLANMLVKSKADCQKREVK